MCPFYSDSSRFFAINCTYYKDCRELYKETVKQIPGTVASNIFFYRFFIYKINNNKSGKAKSVGKFLACFSFFKIFDGAWPINTIHTVLIKLLSYI
jgi:hypothetical protein